jgi:dihydroorotase/N-acyl-D-amino-acid deacylase
VNPISRPLLLIGATVVDGTGASPYLADISVVDDRIASISPLKFGVIPRALPETPLVIDCKGMVVAPGFIDVHSHSDLQVVEGRTEKLVQGVTTEIVGNCGFSPFPLPANPDALRRFANGIFAGGNDWGWNSASEYLQSAAQSPTANVAALVGHGSLRVKVAGHACRQLTKTELDKMIGLLDDELSQGAAGLSSGLMYSPGSAATADELTELCCVTARHGAVYATHIRDYAARLVEAVEEQIMIAERSGCRLQISHLQAVGEANWPLQQKSIAAIEDAVARGVDITFDAYPWLAGSTVLTQLLPQSALDGGFQTFRRKIEDRWEREQIVLQVEAEHGRRWKDLFLSSVKHNDSSIVGRSIQEIAAERAVAPSIAVLDILDEQEGEANILEYNQSLENLHDVLAHPLCLVVTDGLYTRGQPHPRLYGTFPLLLGEVVRERQWLTLAEAVRKVTFLPAERLHLQGQGCIRSGSAASLVIFDPEKIQNHATYDDPTRKPTGIAYVIRNGRILVEPDVITN